jgi:hypothetical protein
MAEVSEFDVMRQRIRERELQRGKQASEQVKGQFASRGLLASGGQIKAQQQAQRDVARQAGEERRDVLIAEAQTRRAQREAEAQRAFQRGERLGSQEFTASQAGEQRKFLTGERIGSQEFTAGQAGAQREFLTSERLGAQAFTTEERNALQSFQEKMEAGRQDFTTAERAAAEKFQASQAEEQRTFLAGESEADRELRRELAEAGFDQAEQDRAVRISQYDRTLAHQKELLQQNADQFYEELRASIKTTKINAFTALKNAGLNDDQIKDILSTVGLGLGYFQGPVSSGVQEEVDDVQGLIEKYRGVYWE